jgi:Uma2 family endonuclease
MGPPRPQLDPPATSEPSTDTPLPPVQRLFGVPYGAYVQIRNDPRNEGLRLTYFDGVLEIMSPEYLHERVGERLGLLVRVVADAIDLPYSGAGSTTFRRGELGRRRGKGKEPDRSFYFANEPRIRGRTSLDLRTDPPPDLWIEVDNRGSSRGRLPAYDEFGVPEVWQYHARTHRLRFLRLDDARTGFVDIDRSVNLPVLTPSLVLFALDQGRGQADSEWCRWLRDWAAQLPRP